MDSVSVGQPVPPVSFTPDEVTLLRFGAVTRNTHRIHYDTAFARSEGLAGPVVMAQLHGCLFHRAAADFAGGTGRVREIAWQNRAPAHAGDRLEVTGTVRAVDPVRGEATLDLVEHCGPADGEGPGGVCCRGHAVVVLASAASVH
ncbi:MaoC/PaaZ C-terminal domain-containing protein [Streptomyces sp. NRRL F-5135]|uniref:MaoC/PaaZ C-terminal domain-containing protein n=1 Tax=Streptomyces sp. NRRL F-5135 TaxID=1463858 RepID=UPI0004C87853|nr:MaoC/PaaZ C-terminal domain-containing protein [Streptomyces sp. NRRL F-5135]